MNTISLSDAASELDLTVDELVAESLNRNIDFVCRDERGTLCADLAGLQIHLINRASERRTPRRRIRSARMRSLHDRLQAIAAAFKQDDTVYAIREECWPFNFKIGYCSIGARQRLQAMQTGNPRQLVVARTFNGNIDAEAIALATLSPERIRGEWFRCGDLVNAFLLSPGPSIADAIVAAAALRR